MTTTDTAVTTEMKRRIANGCDPISGEPWKICEPHAIVMRAGVAVCKGCGQPVTEDEKGGWEHL